MERKSYSYEEKTDILKKSSRKCAHCGVPLTEYNCTIEHCYPFARGGEDTYANIVALCYDCNQRKGNATFFPEEYYSYLNDRYLKILSDYVESKCYKEDYPLGDVIRFVYDNSDAVKNAVNRQKTNRNKRIIRNRTSSKSYLYSAYPADAEELLKFVIKSHNFKYRTLIGDKKFTFKLKDEWLANRALTDTIKHDRVYIITNTLPGRYKYVEYQAYIIFNRIRDLEIIEDTDNVLKMFNYGFILTGYSFYKAPTNVLPMFNSMAQYSRENDTFIPILEFCSKKEYPRIQFKGKDKYSFVAVEFKNTINPIPQCIDFDYSEQLLFFRVPKCVAYGQPPAAELYRDIVNDNHNSGAFRYT